MRIDDAMSSTRLDALALVRNLIVHSNGETDSIFRTQAEGVPIINKFTKPRCTKIPIDGKLTRQLIQGILRPVCALVQSTDQWVHKHP